MKKILVAAAVIFLLSMAYALFRGSPVVYVNADVEEAIDRVKPMWNELIFVVKQISSDIRAKNEISK